MQPSVGGQSYHITGDLWNSTKEGAPYHGPAPNLTTVPNIPASRVPSDRQGRILFLIHVFAFCLAVIQHILRSMYTKYI